MTFYGLIQDGAVISIESDGISNKNYSPAKFWFADGVIRCQAAIFGEDAQRQDLTERKFNKHIWQMMAEGFKVTIQPRRA